VKLIAFHNSLPGGAGSYLEVLGTTVAFAVAGTINPSYPGGIDDMLARCRPIVDWLADASGEATGP
jgi:hypothetical protein